MTTALVMGIALMYLILVMQFGSFSAPLAVMLSLPLSLIGVVLALLLTGGTLNLMSFIGVIMLMGLVAKNAILLLDAARSLEAEGMEREDALMAAGRKRLRPILMTTFGGVPKRGIYDNMKTAVDKVGKGKERTVNARFQAMCSHYLFEPDFCNRAAGWEKGIVEKNVQDRRRQIWHAVLQRHWNSLAELNVWLAQECRAAQQDMRHPDWPDMTLLEVLEHEQPHLMPNPKPFDGYVEHPARVTGTALIHVQRNRYSVPVEYAHKVVSVRVYPEELVIVHDDNIIVRLTRCFDRHQTFYDWQHYIPVIQRKPGALRNGAPFNDMPLPLIQLQKHLLKREGGDRVMAQVLAVVPEHGVEAVVVAVELALESGRPSAEHVLNVLARLKQPLSLPESITGDWLLQEAPQANVERYDLWRSPLDAQEVNHVD